MGCLACDAVRRSGRCAAAAVNVDADSLLVREAQAVSHVACDQLVLKCRWRVERLLARSVRHPPTWPTPAGLLRRQRLLHWIYRISVNAAKRHRDRQRSL